MNTTTAFAPATEETLAALAALPYRSKDARAVVRNGLPWLISIRRSYNETGKMVSAKGSPFTAAEISTLILSGQYVEITNEDVTSEKRDKSSYISRSVRSYITKEEARRLRDLFNAADL